MLGIGGAVMAGQSSAGLSIWWPTPARPESHFSSDELARSRSHHGPLRRVGLLGLAAKMSLLVVGAVVAGLLADRGGQPARWPEGIGWIDAVFADRVILGVGLAVVALRLPATVVDAWFEFRFRHGVEGYRPVPGLWFAGTAMTLAAGSMLAGVAVTGPGYKFLAGNRYWPVAFFGMTAAAVLLFAVMERSTGRLRPDREVQIDADSPIRAQLQALGHRFDMPGVRFSASRLTPAARSVEEPGPNAYATGFGPNRRIVMTESLLEERAETRGFVVAHELSHLARRHVRAQSIVSVLASGATIAVLALLIGWGQPWRWLGLEPDDPIGVPVAVLVVFVVNGALGPLTGWLSRAQERSADAGAIEAVGPLGAGSARRLYVATTADLDPPWWARLYARHPAPAERLEFLARHRRLPAR